MIVMMCFPRSIQISLLVGGLALMGSSASAGPILYAPQLGLTVQIETFEPVGQSFVAEDELVEVGLHFAVINGTFDASEPIRYDLYVGQGIGGPLVASATFILPDSMDRFFHVEDFSSTPLTPGNTYSVVASVVGTSPYWAVTRSLEPPAGTGIGAQFPEFRYALSVNPIPEPDTTILLSLGLVGLAAKRRRWRAAARATH